MLAVVAVGCWSCGPKPFDVCLGVACTNGRCVVDRGAAACLCDDGFAPDGLACVAHVVDPCLRTPAQA
jgi:hypothetical protein